jgi:choline dehydrogenase
MADEQRSIPRSADVVVVGGGSAGAVVAGRLAAHSDRSVVLLEAGPDYGPHRSGRWPRGLLDARCLPQGSHDWKYTSAARHGRRNLPLERARAVGGCSAHNGCAAVWGARADYDGWEALGNPGWGAEALLPLFHDANARLRVRTPPRSALGPFHDAVLDASPGAGFPITDDLCDLDGGVGISNAPINVHDGVRWNAAFAYLDPVRASPNLTIFGHALADRLVIEGGRARAVDAITPTGRIRVEAGEIVVAGGAFGSPALLLRSGVGASDTLQVLGIEPVHALPGVGENLHDHPVVLLDYPGTPALVAAMQAFMARAVLREEATIAKGRSRLCDGAFDLHLFPLGSPYWNLLPRLGTDVDHATASWGDGREWLFALPIANMAPRSRGRLRLAGPDPETAPIIDHGYFTDEDDRDLAVLLDGIDLGRTLMGTEPLASLVGPETGPAAKLFGGRALADHVRATGAHYYHPVGSCKMGPAGDPLAVVDARGRVHGLEGLRVADASIMPVIPRANTNLPAIVVGEKIAALMLEERYST